MKRLCISLFLLVASFVGFCQTGEILTSPVNVEKFPTLSFSQKSYSPEVKRKADFSITDNGVEQAFDFEHFQDKCNQTLLFLWEDLSANGTEPYNAFKNVLKGFFNANLKTTDKFSIAVFNRETNSGELLNSLTPFTSDKTMLENAVSRYAHNTTPVKSEPQYSDLYKSIYKGMDLLNRQPEENVKAIVVLTLGWNLKGGGAQSELAAVQQKAKELHIPIYIILYRAHGGKPEITTLAEDTYGQTTSMASENVALNDLISFYYRMSERHSPHTYKFTYSTEPKKDGKKHDIVLKMNAQPIGNPSYIAPSFSLLNWAKENMALAIVILVVIVALIVLTILLIVKKIKRKNIENQAKLDNLENQRLADRDAAEAKQHELEAKMAHEKAEFERKECEKAEQTETERLQKLMQVKNIYPRLQCMVGGEKFVHNVSQVSTTIGRNKNNDLVLPHSTVSREHAILKFTGGGFEISNKSKTNKLIVNGNFVEHATLKNADIIGFGEAVVTVFL